MANKPRNVTVRADLTAYAHGVGQDLNAILRTAEILAPTVPTGGTSGLYNKFDDTQAFKAYAEAVARRAVGGQANAITFGNDTANYNVHPFGLRVSIDEFERAQAADNMGLLEQAKVRTLTVNCALAHLTNVVTKAKASVSAATGKGAWNEANIDPIQEINDQIKAVWLASGILPNNVAIDFGAWCVLSGNANILKRMPGADIAAVTPTRIQGMLVNPEATVSIVSSASLYGGGSGNTAATRRGVLAGSVLIFNNSVAPTQYDPSFMKTFSPSASLFTSVYSYREEPHLDWYENDWQSDTQVVASALCKRIDVTGANS